MHIRSFVISTLRKVLYVAEAAAFFLWQKPLFMLWRKMNRAAPLSLPCLTPFHNYEVFPDGQCYLCCPRWLPVVVGFAGNGDFGRSFNSIKAQKIRISMFKGTYKYCDLNECILINSANNKRYDADRIASEPHVPDRIKEGILRREIIVPLGPSRVTENISELCNVRCEFCTITHQKNDHEKATARLNSLQKYAEANLDNLSIIAFCGGEPLIQRHVKSIIKKSVGKDASIYITSNLNKIDDELKHDLSLVNIYGFHCSINAASAEVYKEICGGDWLSVMGNLDFVLKLREKSGRSFWVSISMVVTNRNYRQVVDFAKLGLEKKADKIIYYSLNETSFNQHQRLDENEKNLVLQMLKEAVFSENPEKFEVSPDLRVE